MDDERPLFILAGNGPYENRGCEAIVRGTVKILREYYHNPEFICVSNFQNIEQYLKQSENEFDQSIKHKKTNLKERPLSPRWWVDSFIQIISPEKKKYKIYSEILPYLDNSYAILSIGGDNYSLDYGIPHLFTDLDDLIIKKSKPLIIWGASVGPFDKIPDYEKFMSIHLQKITGIFARESATVNYLKRIIIEKNVFPVADPAFLLDPEQPSVSGVCLEIDDDAIGINISPLMAKFVTNDNRNLWVNKSADIIAAIAKKMERKIFLIPHVTSAHDNDYKFLDEILVKLEKLSPEISLIPPIYNAAETKWIISQMKFFIGSRTHSTIAALSSEVPTLSLGYSIKSLGINQDLFGHTEYCLNPQEFKPDIIARKVCEMIDSDNSIKDELHLGLPAIRQNAMNAGKYMREICG
jgi:polysaccharide pyruvyl transferase WcaK-like protein